MLWNLHQVVLVDDKKWGSEERESLYKVKPLNTLYADNILMHAEADMKSEPLFCFRISGHCLVWHT